VIHLPRAKIIASTTTDLEFAHVAAPGVLLKRLIASPLSFRGAHGHAASQPGKSVEPPWTGLDHEQEFGEFRRVEGGGGRHPLSNYATWLVAGARNHRYRLVSKRAQTRFNLYLRECTGLALIRRKLA